MTLEFRRGVQTFHDIYPGDEPNLKIMLGNLGKIVKHKEVVGNITTYTYTDGSWDSFGG
jgi:hypothetical protein